MELECSVFRFEHSILEEGLSHFRVNAYRGVAWFRVVCLIKLILLLLERDSKILGKISRFFLVRFLEFFLISF